MNPPISGAGPSRKLVAGEVRAAMARADVTQVQLATAMTDAGCPISQTALSERLSGQRPFNTDHLYAIAQALSVNPLSLLVQPVSA